MNVELLRKVQKHIQEEPRRLEMSCVIRKSAVAPCGTAGCIAGWAAILSGRIDPKEANAWQFNDGMVWAVVQSAAVDELKLPIESEKLFFVAGWPEPFKTQYYEADWDEAQTKANVTAARIQHLIDKGE